MFYILKNLWNSSVDAHFIFLYLAVNKLITDKMQNIFIQ